MWRMVDGVGAVLQAEGRVWAKTGKPESVG